MSNSLLKRHDQEISCEPVYRIANGMCIKDHNCRNLPKKPWLKSSNDPLQDYIRRTLSGKLMCRSNEKVPIVYSTLSKEKGEMIRPVQKYTSSSNETTPRRFFITSAPVKSNSAVYHPYLNQKRAKYVVINRNGINGVVKKRPDSGRLESKEEANKMISQTGRLDFIEQYISLNTNKFGYVPLNETILQELGTAILECLSRKIAVTKVKCVPLYEPISPAGCSEDED